MNAPALVCNYALLRFRPDPEGGEFVIVGFALWCETARAFRFCCDKRCAARVHAFFPDLDLKHYEHAVSEMAEEMMRVGAGITFHAEGARRAYQELIRQREGMLSFGPNATAATNDVDALEQQLISKHLRTGAREAPIKALAGYAA
jgi:hypothetical protein